MQPFLSEVLIDDKIIMNEIARLVELANDRLRKGSVGVTIEVRGQGNWLYLRGTMPPSPTSRKVRPHQQRIALKMRASPAAIKQAEATAKVIGGELNLGVFSWTKWSDAEVSNDSKLVKHWIVELEESYWRSRDRKDPSKQNTWNTTYASTAKRLPQNEELTTELLVDWIITYSDPETSRRIHYCTCAKALSQLAGLPTEAFKELATGQGIRPVNPRHLPSDAEIVEAIATIADPGWRFLVRMQTVYGLRNHECFKLDYSDFPVIRVCEKAKTGARPVKPLYPEWAIEWKLNEPIYPQNANLSDLSIGNKRLGAKITYFFEHNMPWAAYNLRHCYARRCAEFDIPPHVAARLMGHSTKVHETVYQAWVGEQVFLRSADRAINRSDRPRPPEVAIPESQEDKS